ncbi:hypothetical protein [Streptococcus halichoeri]|uniref:hypothetical protein n=1 Tax=Streptococcus halichoeri TaxID=254785 RepID=UPI0013570766|nr:hypothetical protein [Streptococcus halichoeri]
MSDNLEIVMDIDTLEIFEVFDLNDTSEIEGLTSKNNTRGTNTFNSEIGFNQVLLFRSFLMSRPDYCNQIFCESS